MNWRWCGAVGLQYGLVACATVLVVRWPLLSPLAWAFYGTRQAALAVLGHDAVHGQVCRNRRLNDALGAFAFWPVTITVGGYRRFHFPHHLDQGGAGDLERQIQERHHRGWVPQHKGAQIVRDLFGAGIAEIGDLNRIMFAGHGWSALPMAATLAGVAAILLWTGLWLPLVLWSTSLVTAFWTLVRIRGWGEHIGYPGGGTWAHDKPGVLVRWTWLPYGIWLHAEHHRSPWLTPRELLRARA